MSGDEYLREQEERLAAMAREEAVARFEQQEQEREEQALVLSKEALDAHNKQMQPSESAGRLEHAHANAPARTLSCPPVPSGAPPARSLARSIYLYLDTKLAAGYPRAVARAVRLMAVTL